MGLTIEKRNVAVEVYDEFKDFKLLTPAEKDLFKGLKTKRAQALQENGVRKALGVVLGMESTVSIDGEEVVVTNAERLAARTFQEAMQNPSTTKLKDIAHIMGEDKITVDAKVEGGSEIFLGIVKDGDEEEEVEVPDDSDSR